MASRAEKRSNVDHALGPARQKRPDGEEEQAETRKA